MKCGLNNQVALFPDGQSSLLIVLSLLAAFWPVWIWYGQRLCDQSDEPLGIVALITLLGLVAFQQSEASGARPMTDPVEVLERNETSGAASAVRTIPISLSAMLALYCISLFFAPKLLSAALALITLGLCLNHILPRRLNSGQWSLLLLSLPLVASLNFYLGYPLRLVVAQLAVSLLSINGFALVAEGTSLLWHNQLIEIDAPCSGIKMLWAALYMATVQLSLRNARATQAALYLALAAAVAMLANVLRVTSLFYLEAGIIALPAEVAKSVAALFESAVHTGTGVTAFLLVALILFFADKRLGKSITNGFAHSPTKTKTSAAEDQPASPAQRTDAEELASGSRQQPPNAKATRLSTNNYFFIACTTAVLVPFFSMQKLGGGTTGQSSTTSGSQATIGSNQANWPTSYEGQKLIPRPLSTIPRAGIICVFRTTMGCINNNAR